MNDTLVSELRKHATPGSSADQLMNAAADEIERLREALQWMVDHDESGPDDYYHLDGLERAKAALNKTPTE